MSLAEPRLTAPVAWLPWYGPRAGAACLTLAMTAAIIGAFAAGVAFWTPLAVMALPLMLLAALWISGGTATALLGMVAPAPAPGVPLAGWRPQSRTAILVTLCNEDPFPLARHLEALRAA
jgi:membrane glycosyltransferase